MQYHETAVVPRESILRTEAEWLTSINADLVVLLLLDCSCLIAMHFAIFRRGMLLVKSEIYLD